MSTSHPRRSFRLRTPSWKKKFRSDPGPLASPSLEEKERIKKLRNGVRKLINAQRFAHKLSLFSRRQKEIAQQEKEKASKDEVKVKFDDSPSIRSTETSNQGSYRHVAKKLDFSEAPSSASLSESSTIVSTATNDNNNNNNIKSEIVAKAQRIATKTFYVSFKIFVVLAVLNNPWCLCFVGFYQFFLAKWVRHITETDTWKKMTASRRTLNREYLNTCNGGYHRRFREVMAARKIYNASSRLFDES